MCDSCYLLLVSYDELEDGFPEMKIKDDFFITRATWAIMCSKKMNNYKQKSHSDLR